MANCHQDLVVIAVDDHAVSQEPPSIFRGAFSALIGDLHPGDGAFEFLCFCLHRLSPLLNVGGASRIHPDDLLLGPTGM